MKNDSTSVSGYWSASDHWLESAAFLGIGLRISPISADPWAAYHNLMLMCREQYASEFSYARFIDACDSKDDLEEIVQGYLELHSFIVSAHLYWQTLSALDNTMQLEDFGKVLKMYAVEIEHTKKARNHLEHIDERIGKGRDEKRGGVMSPQEFRRSMGRYSAGKVIFGSEETDLAAIHIAICNIGRKIAPKIRDQISARVSVQQQ